MKIEVSNLTEAYLQDYTLTKKFENNFLVKQLNANAIYEGDNYKYLLEASATALDQESGVIKKMCDDYEFMKEVHIKHIDGTFNFKNCTVQKNPVLQNTLDCIIEQKINIFDFAASNTNTIEGQIYRQLFYVDKIIPYNKIDHNGFGSVLNKLTLEDVYGYLGSIPDSSQFGFYPEYGTIQIDPIIETGPDGQTVSFALVSIKIVYVQLWSAIKESIYWKPAPFGGYFYPLNNPLRISNEIYEEILVGSYLDNFLYQKSTWKVGSGDKIKYDKKDISNTYLINPIITKIFECVGKNVISNFLGINPDGSNPDNEYYDYADLFCQQLKIVQSFDIIRASAIRDSFGISGLFDVKDFIRDICLIFNLVISETDENIYIEHKSFYTGKGINLLNKDYEISEMEMNRDQVDAERFEYAINFSNDDSFRADLVYRQINPYAETNQKTFKTKLFVTDVFSALNQEKYNENDYEKLFFLLSTNGDSIVSLNDALTMSQVVKSLHDLDRPLKRVKFNGDDYEFLKYSIGLGGDIKIKGSLKMYDAIDPFMSLITDFGTFVIEEFSIDQNDLMTFKIKK